MQIKIGIYPNCSEWDEEVYADNDIFLDDIDLEEAVKEVKEGAKAIKDWD